MKEQEGELFFGNDHDNDMRQFETYENIEINQKNKDIKEKAEELVNSICDTYFSIFDDIEDEDSGIKKVKEQLKHLKLAEVSVVTQLSKQIIVAEHLLDTMLRRLDSGGFTDDSLYQNIRDQQNSLTKFSIDFSKYVRTLPEYFDGLRTDLGVDKANLLEKVNEIKMLNKPAYDPIMLEESTDEEYTALPARGNKDLILNIQNQISKVQQRYEQTDDLEIDFDPNEINPTDDE